MDQFVFHVPTKIIFGKSIEKNVGVELKQQGVKKVLVHYGKESAVKNGLLENILKSLNDENIQYVLLGGVVPNPRLDKTKEGIKLSLEEKVDFILAIGGGSVIDSAKAIALGIANPTLDIWEDIFKNHAIHKPAFPVGVVLTIAASGSESSNNSLLMNEFEGVKLGYVHPSFVPKVAFLNPELTYTLPPFQTACGVVDIMMHTLERYFYDNRHNYLTDKIAESVLRTSIKYGKVLLNDPTNYEARSEIMWAGSLSHNSITGLGGKGGFVCHPIQHELSAMFDVTHAAGLSVIWPKWARYVYERDVERFADYAINVWDVLPSKDLKKVALEGIIKTEEFFKLLKMPLTNEELGVGKLTEEQINHMADHVTNKGEKVLGAVVKVNKDDIANIYRMAN